MAGAPRQTIHETYKGKSREACLSQIECPATFLAMYVVTEADAAAVREVYERDGELSAAIELRRRFPGITDKPRRGSRRGPLLGGQLLPPRPARRPRKREGGTVDAIRRLPDAGQRGGQDGRADRRRTRCRTDAVGHRVAPGTLRRFGAGFITGTLRSEVSDSDPRQPGPLLDHKIFLRGCGFRATARNRLDPQSGVERRKRARVDHMHECLRPRSPPQIPPDILTARRTGTMIGATLHATIRTI